MAISQLFFLVKRFKEEIKEYLTADFSSLSLEQKRQKVAEVSQKAAFAGAAVAPIPLPFADVFTITPIQMTMVAAIGNIYGYQFNEKQIKAVFATIAGGWLGQQTCLALFKIGLPGAGGFMGAAFVFAWTKGLAKVASLYFESGMTLNATELKIAREKSVQESKGEAFKITSTST
jgi:uncharacterized protein (DUF697 family)